MSTSVASVASHFPYAQNGFSTTLASTISSGATTVPLNSVAGYTNGLPAVFVVDPTDASKKQTFTGIIDTSGVQVTSVVWTAGTNQTHTGGATVVDYATATHISMVSKGTLISLDQDGTLKAGAVDNAAVLASDVVTSTKILANAVQADDLATNAITLGYAQITGNITTASTSQTQATGLTSTVTVPAGGRRVKITFFGNVQTNTNVHKTTITIWDGTVGSGTQLGAATTIVQNSGNDQFIQCQAVVTPAAGSKTYNIGWNSDSGAVTWTMSASATQPAFILVETI